ncbi:putative transcription factor STY-LRP1 family [Rosa chinensis]|uniref:Putative transcription factor STY-LRP1 family n=1 Tax=Rosa chinensis TaxID=74649 RepID=A0A2P6PPR9_ROSCH|nr:protein SHI RELATED SEQUENCE 3 [Rosa chinensis]PRQ23938.1 putative transcription factor STY-LRP1 family [Rosa chinensis]
MGSRSRCEDCGNKAKKECVYMRCRTCCKNKGFRCQTHVKSTWVPLCKRSLLHEQQHPNDDHHRQQQLAIDQGHIFINPDKKLRQHNPSSSCAGLDRDHQEANFPAEVTTMAKFQGIRVSSMDDMVDLDQHAYQTSVIIGGHVFRGILHDQGPAVHQMNYYTSASAADQPHHPPSYQLINPFNAFMPAGTQFFQNLSS